MLLTVFWRQENEKNIMFFSCASKCKCFYCWRVYGRGAKLKKTNLSFFPSQNISPKNAKVFVVAGVNSGDGNQELHQEAVKHSPRLERLKKENKCSESNLYNPTIARYVGYKLISCKTLKIKPCSRSFSLGFSTSEADHRVFPAVKRKPHDINNNTARNRELHPTHFWQQRTSPGGKVCLNNHFSESGECHLVE